MTIVEIDVSELRIDSCIEQRLLMVTSLVTDYILIGHGTPLQAAGGKKGHGYFLG